MAEITQPYDSSLKALFEGHAAEVLRHLLNVDYLEDLGTEALQPSVRPDRMYLGRYRDMLIVLHLELETASDSEIVYRLLEYFGILYRKYRKPIMSVILYPFRASLPKSPLRVTIGDEVVLEFHFRVIPLWKESAKDYVDQHVVVMYPLLPTMQDASYDRLAQALDEMKEWYGDNKWLFGERVAWFDVFLERTDMVSPEDKRKLEEKMEEFGSLVEQSRLVRKKIAEKVAEAEAKAQAEGEARGRVEALQEMLVDIVQERFPPLTELAQQASAEVKEPQQLRRLVKQVSIVPDENAARWILRTFAA